MIKCFKCCYVVFCLQICLNVCNSVGMSIFFISKSSTYSLFETDQDCGQVSLMSGMWFSIVLLKNVWMSRDVHAFFNKTMQHTFLNIAPVGPQIHFTFQH